MLVSELIGYALQELGVLEAGGTAGTNDLNLGFSKLNDVLATLSTSGVTIFYSVLENFPLVSGTGSYTIGSGGTFNTPRPVEIEEAFIRDSGGIDHPVAIRPFSEYMRISDKDCAGRPIRLYYNPTYPYGTIYLYYTPDTVENLYIKSKKPLPAFTATSSTISLPLEYVPVLHHLLVQSLAPFFGKTLTPLQLLNAKIALGGLISKNIAATMKEALDLGLPGGGSAYNVDEG